MSEPWCPKCNALPLLNGQCIRCGWGSGHHPDEIRAAERARCAAEVREMWENGVPPQEYAARILAGPEGE